MTHADESFRDFADLLNRAEPKEVSGPDVNQSIKQFPKGRIKFKDSEVVDLHHAQTLQAAMRMLNSFIRESHQYRSRYVLVITGKGKHSRDGGAVLRSEVDCWLKKSSMVQSHKFADPKDGGEGAFYVLIEHG